MFFKQLFDPASSTFTYLIADDASHEAVLIDPVIDQVDRDVWLLREHADHVTAAHALKQATGTQTAVCQDCNAQGYDRLLKDGDVVLFGHEEILTIATPGHTPGSVSYLWRDRIFTGDTLLIGGCGRTDFQNGSAEALWASITEKLFRLDGQILVYPCHDYKGRRLSSIGEEKQFNARVAGKTRDEFLATMNNLNLPMPKRIHEAVPVNLSGGAGIPATIEEPQAAEEDFRVLSVSAQQLAAELQTSPKLRLLDVRTPAEFASLRIQGSIDVPFDRLDPAGLMGSFGIDAPLYCVCQTGTRSQLAAQMLRAAGFRRVVHVDGGTNAWQAAGLPVVRGERSTISLERQVRIAAGALVLASVAAGAFIHPLGYALAALVGAGLMQSGLSSFCGISMLLAKMPWNQVGGGRADASKSASSG
jgi:sulfur dioxygenase